jgi:hypothetical protein
MTNDMSFECLLVSHDSGVYSAFDRLLRQLSVHLEVCLSPAKALAQLAKGSTDLVVVDWEGEDSSTLLREIRNLVGCKQPTIIGICSSSCAVPGAHILLKKPVTMESGAKSLKSAYGKMLQDHRRHSRHALMLPVIATDEEGRTWPVTVTDIGEGGIGLSSSKEFLLGEALTFRLRLPGMHREIYIEARVLWGRDYARIGCEFIRIPPVDRNILHDWVDTKLRVKKPLTEL